jgi:protein-disulfide isomerase
MAKQEQQAPRKAAGPQPVKRPASGGAVRSTRVASRRKSNNTGWVLWVVVGAVVLILVGVVVLQNQAMQRPVVNSNTISEGLTWGPANAPVTIVEYSNFGCPHCRDFAENQEKQLRQEYEAGGKVRLVFEPFSLGSQPPDDAAAAAYCAADQKRFWDYHDVLFSQQGVSANPFTPALLKQYAAQLKLDTAKFNQCLDAGTHVAEVHQVALDGQSRGVDSTPTFFVNSQQVLGAVPYDQIKAAVDAQLKAAGAG